MLIKLNKGWVIKPGNGNDQNFQEVFWSRGDILTLSSISALLSLIWAELRLV